MRMVLKMTMILLRVLQILEASVGAMLVSTMLILVTMPPRRVMLTRTESNVGHCDNRDVGAEWARGISSTLD